jgi:hypothetical protein
LSRFLHSSFWLFSLRVRHKAIIIGITAAEDTRALTTTRTTAPLPGTSNRSRKP